VPTICFFMISPSMGRQRKRIVFPNS